MVDVTIVRWQDRLRRLSPCTRASVAAALLAWAVTASGAQKLSIGVFGNSITGSFRGAASYRFHLWRHLVDSGFAVKGEERVDFVGYYCGVGDQNTPGDCGYPAYDSSLWDWDHDGYHAHQTISLPSIARTSGLVAQSLGYHHGHNIALVHMGTNDLLNVVPIDSSRARLSRTIDTLRNRNPYVIVFLCQLIPFIHPYGNKAVQNDSLARFNAMIPLLAAEKNLPHSPVYVVDQFTGYHRRDDNAMDGIHPNSNGERKIASRYAAALCPVLAQITTPPTVRMAPGGAIWGARTQRLTLSVRISSAVTSVYPHRGVRRVAFYRGATFLGYGSPENDSVFSISWQAPDTGLFSIHAVANDYCHRTAVSDTVQVVIAGSSVAYDLRPDHIQGAGYGTPYAMRRVRTRGIVTMFDADTAVFWIQLDTIPGNPRDAKGRFIGGDPYPWTSNALKVAAGDYRHGRTKPEIGDSVVIWGMAREVYAGPEEAPVTTLSPVDSVLILRTGSPLPHPQPLTDLWDDWDIKEAMARWERLEGMLVSVADAVVVGPTDNDGCTEVVLPKNKAPGSGYSAGILFAGLHDGVHADYNPERVRIDWSTYPTPVALQQADTVRVLHGVVDYRRGRYVVLPVPGSAVWVQREIPDVPVSSRYSPAGTSGEMTSWNLGGLFDAVDDPGRSDPVWSQERYQTAIAKVCKAITDELLLPRILAVQGVEDVAILDTIAARLNRAEGTGYRAVSFEGGRKDGLECGFLWDTMAFVLEACSLLSGPDIDAAFGADSSDGASARPLFARFYRPAYTYLNIVNMDLADPAPEEIVMGRRAALGMPHSRVTESRRRRQAYAIRAFVNRLINDAHVAYRRVIVTGDIGDYDFDEAGEADAGGNPVVILMGDTLRGEVKLASAWTLVKPSHNSRYSAIREGNAVRWQQMLMSPAMLRWVAGANALHFNARFPTNMAADSTTTIRAASTDPLEIRW